MTGHRCDLRLNTAAPAPYRVVCPTCGTVGVPQEYLGDAEAIAARHEEIGGGELPR